MLPSLPRPGRASSFRRKAPIPPATVTLSSAGQPLALRRAAAEPVGQPLAVRREVEADRVDAIPLAGRRRAVGEDVALVRTAARADDLGADHAVAGVADVGEMLGAERLGEARPAGA